MNMDFSENVVVAGDKLTWVDSPTEGVTRVKLEREEDESGHVTSFVRFAAGASFPQHHHPQGEEIYVMEGTFSDETGDYPAGSYLRNPAGSCHTPYSKEGCKIFVKLDQFSEDDNSTVLIHPHEHQWRPGIGGLKVLPLHEYKGEHTALVYWPANEVFQPHRHWGGEEIVVLEGTFCDEYGKYPTGSWLRSPHLSQHSPYVEDQATIILVKVGHLPEA